MRERSSEKGFSIALVSDYRGAIYGFAILWIAFFHAWAIDHVDYSFGHDSLMWFRTIMNAGNVGVDIYLFLSGISLYQSFHRDQDSYNFIRKRMLRVFLPVVLIDGLYWFIRFAVFEGSFAAFVSRITMLSFWMTGDQTIWFVSLIVILYFMYPFIYGFLYNGSKDQRSFLWRCILLLLAAYVVLIAFYKVSPYYKTVEIAVTRIPAFLIGAFAGKAVYERKKIPNALIPLFVVIALAFFAALHYDAVHNILRRFMFAAGGISICFILAVIFSFLDRLGNKATDQILRFFTWVGGFSLELYLSHIMLNQIYRLTDLYIKGNFVRYFIVICIAFILAWIMSIAVMKLRNLITGDGKSKS